jgi:hypothetical protein
MLACLTYSPFITVTASFRCHTRRQQNILYLEVTTCFGANSGLYLGKVLTPGLRWRCHCERINIPYFHCQKARQPTLPVRYFKMRGLWGPSKLLINSALLRIYIIHHNLILVISQIEHLRFNIPHLLALLLFFPFFFSFFFVPSFYRVVNRAATIKILLFFPAISRFSPCTIDIDFRAL